MKTAVTKYDAAGREIQLRTRGNKRCGPVQIASCRSRVRPTAEPPRSIEQQRHPAQHSCRDAGAADSRVDDTGLKLAHRLNQETTPNRIAYDRFFFESFGVSSIGTTRITVSNPQAVVSMTTGAIRRARSCESRKQSGAGRRNAVPTTGIITSSKIPGVEIAHRMPARSKEASQQGASTSRRIQCSPPAASPRANRCASTRCSTPGPAAITLVPAINLRLIVADAKMHIK